MTDAPSNSVHPSSRAEWRKPQLTYEEAVEEALSFGWIDGKPNKLDAERTMLWFSPRKPGTGWSRHDKERVEKLIAAESEWR